MKELELLDYAAIAADPRHSEEFRASCVAFAREAEYRLLSRAESNTKLRKSMRTDYKIVSLSLAHHKTSGHNVCGQASRLCSSSCVGGDNVGLASIWTSVMDARIKRTKYLFSDRQRFIRQMIGELELNRIAAESAASQLVARINCYSDCPWHTTEFGCIPQMFPMVQFYDYCKEHDYHAQAPANWHLTPSWSELKRHQNRCLEFLNNGVNIAMAFAEDGPYAASRAGYQTLPQWVELFGQRFQCFDGDNGTGFGCNNDEPHYDLRFLDPGPTKSGRGRVCALRLKGNVHSRTMAMEGGFSVVR